MVARRKRTAKPAGPIGVDAIRHDEKRINIPTADAQEFMPETPEVTVRFPLVEAPGEVSLAANERDPALDPQLVWRDKYFGDPTELVAEAPPIYIQEKIDPQVLIENLRDSSRRLNRSNSKGGGEPADTPTLFDFDDFDGLDTLDSIDFYKHAANWSNRMILGDSFQVMASLAEREALRGQVQMIYIDPPYGIKFGSNWQARVGKRDVKDGKIEDAAREAEQIKAFRDTWKLGIHTYLTYLRDRLIVARDLLTDSGSVFVQIGDENVHLVRCLLDEVFGSANLCSQIAFMKTTGLSAEILPEGIDYLLWYAKDRTLVKARRLWRQKSRRDGTADTYSWLCMPDGSYRGMTRNEKVGAEPIPVGAEIYKPDNITSQGNPRFSFSFEGKEYVATYKTTPNGLAQLGRAGRLHVASNSLQYRRLLSDFGQLALNNFWSDTATGSFTDEKVYVVQTGTKTIERCVLLSTDPGDLVLDPTCGSGTTAFAAEKWGRRWITIDTSRVALALARQRLMGARYPSYLLADSPEGRQREVELARKPLPPTPTHRDVRLGFVYERVQRITLGSIANNPDIKEGMTRDEVN